MMKGSVRHQRDDGDPPNFKKGKHENSRKESLHRFLIPIFIFTFLCAALLPLFTPTAQAQHGLTTEINGTVIDKVTGRPVFGATVAVPEFDLQVNTDSFGRFNFSRVGIPSTEHQSDIIVAADGFGDWQMLNVLLISTDTLILDVELSSSPTTITIPDVIPIERTPEIVRSLAEFNDPPTIDQRNEPLPDTIRVRVTESRA